MASEKSSRMADFARRKTRPNSPANAYQRVEVPTQAEDVRLYEANQSRRALAKSLKVPLNRSNLDQLEGMTSGAMGPPPPPQRVRGRQNLNAFDTDSEHADDTTATSISRVQISRNQLDLQGHPLEQRDYDESDNEMSDPPSSENPEEEEAQDDETLTREHEAFAMLNKFNAHQNQIGHGAGIYEDGASYPPTTAGDLESEVYQGIEIDGATDQHQQEGAITSQQQKKSPHFQQTSTNQKNGHMRVNLQHRRATRQNLPVAGLAQGNSNLAMRGGGAQSKPMPQMQNVAPGTRQQPKAGISIHPQLQNVSGRPEPDGPITAHPNDANGTRPGSQTLGADAEEEEIMLDYEPEAIKRMRYSDLEQESCDQNPSEPPFPLPDEVKDQPLTERIEFVAALGPEEKAKFFYSLKMTEWEEAGDWFLQQFGDILNRFRTARKNKRTVTGQMEQRVHDRHKQVERKKRRLDQALGSMRQSGTEVLQGTPQKKRK